MKKSPRSLDEQPSASECTDTDRTPGVFTSRVASRMRRQVAALLLLAAGAPGIACDKSKPEAPDVTPEPLETSQPRPKVIKEKTLEDGTVIKDYSNGVRQLIHPNGVRDTISPNGDVLTEFPGGEKAVLSGDSILLVN